MKKLIALALTLALAASFGSLALADSPITAVPGSDSREVTATYTPATAASTVYSVTVAWGAMAFSYDGESNGSWNPANHTYSATSGSWTGMDGTNNKVTVTNHSNAAVGVTLGYLQASGYTAISGSLNVTTDTLAAGVEGQFANADKLESLLTLSGKPAAAIAAGTTVGTVTVTIAAAV